MDASSAQLFNKSTPAIILVTIVAELGLAIAFAQGYLPLLVVAVSGMGVAVAIFLRPAMGAALFLALAPLEGALMIAGNSLAKLAIIACVGVFFVRNLIDQRGIQIDLTTLTVLPFVLWSCTTILWSSDEGALTQWISFALQSLLYVILINFVQSKEDLRVAIWGHVIGGLVLALLFTNTLVVSDFNRKGLVAGLGLNLAARIVGLNVLLSLFLFQSESRMLGRMILLTSTILSIIGLVVSLSRGAWLAVVLSLAVLIIVYAAYGYIQIKPKMLLGLLLVGFVSIYIMNSYIFDAHGASKLLARFDDGITLKDQAGGRFDIWLVGWNMFVDAPLQGHGFNSFAHNYANYAEMANLSGSLHVEDKTPHNSFVGVLVQLGLIGLGLFLAVLGSILQKIWRIWNKKPVNIQALAWACGLTTFLLISNFVDYAVDRKYLWYVLGLITLTATYWEGSPISTLYNQGQIKSVPISHQSIVRR